VDNLLYDSSNVSISLGEIKRAESGGVLVQVGVRLELNVSKVCL
jgi:hypothetical protein